MVKEWWDAVSIMTDGLSERLAGEVWTLAHSELPDEIVRSAQDRLTDALAVTFNGLREPAAVVARKAVPRAETGRGQTVFGAAGTYAAADAAFVNAVEGHCSLQEDLGAGGHPGTYIIPAAVAGAEYCGSDGLTLLRGLIAGYEAVARIADATPTGLRARGFRPLPAIGGFGAAAAASVAMGLDPDRLRVALDLAANQSGGLYEGFYAGTMEGYFHAGFAARAGVTSALLSQAGATSAFATLDGRSGFFGTYTGDSSPLTDLGPTDASSGYAITAVRAKPFPACALNQGTMLVLSRHPALPIAADDILEVVLERPTGGRNGTAAPGVLNQPPYVTPLQAQMSARFTTAAALLGRPIGELSYYRDHYDDVEVAEVAERIELRSNNDPRARVLIWLRGGDRLLIESPKPEADLWEIETMPERFARLVGPRLGASQVASILAAIEQLPVLPSTQALTNLLAIDCTNEGDARAES